MTASTPTSSRTDLHVALIWPEIPWNTGNTARSCLAFGAQLHLVEPLGFALDAAAVRRAGLDYWQHVRPVVHRDLESFLEELPALGEPWLLTAEGTTPLGAAPLAPPAVLLLGAESVGLPVELRERFADRCVRIPQARGPVRSLNQSSAAAIALAEFRRRHPLP
jgi:tRNA (cytidine/uridine-2'-O-)-methyltransferase